MAPAYHHSSSRGKNKRKRIVQAIVVLVILLGIFFWYKYSQYQYYLQTPVDPADTSKISIVIKKWTAENGENQLGTLAKKMQDQGLILDADTFTLYVKWHHFDRKLVAGRFFIQRSMTIPQIVNIITDIKKGEISLTITEGETIRDIDAKLADLDMIQPGTFIQATKDFNEYEKYPFLDKEAHKALPHPLEGFLFPDTYYLDSSNFNAKSLIQLMLKNFEKKLGDELKDKDASTIFKTVIMASMVEEEIQTEKDRPIVAGILWKRLKEDWLLGVDSTLLYLKNDRTIDANDLADDSPYNTRKNHGLPPGPISNPGLPSLTAAFHPESSEYYFYLTKPNTGEVVYARTNDEHNANREKYLK